VEGVGEAENGQVGGSGLGVVEARSDFLLGPLDALTTLLAAVEHHGGLVGQLVGLRTGLGGEDLVKALGGDAEETILQDIVPLAGREVAQSRTVDEGGDQLGGLSGLDESRVVVANRDGGNLRVAILNVLDTRPEA
jgi:hypothetical protein